MAALLAVVFAAVLLWLRVYTNHGQKLELTSYVGQNFEEAASDAKKASFKLIVKDSIHKVGQPGGVILTQNPGAGNKVKENRKIYVDVTKYNPDEILLKNLSILYGRQYTAKVEELNSLEIKSNVKGYRYDIGESDHILEVWYDGRLVDGASGRKSNVKIKKGDTLNFVLSETKGAIVQIPDLVCQQFSTANFILDASQFDLGSVEQVGAITDVNTAYVIGQNPSYEDGRKINTGTLIEITIQQDQPESCK